MVPGVAKWAKHTYVVQRTPSAIDARNNKPTDPTWAASLKPGWKKERDEDYTAIMAGNFSRAKHPEAITDGIAMGVREAAEILFKAQRTGVGKELGTNTLMQLGDYKKMNRIRDRVKAIVKDKETAEKLQPFYNQMCKRPCFSDDYLQAFNLPNVTLVDSPRGLQALTENGIVVDGKEYPCDLVIWCS